jgi:hypothetical protein
VLRYVTAAQRGFTTANVLAAIQIRMHVGAEIATGYSGSLAIHFLM